MASNSFGTLFRITTWGESHGKGIGVVIDGCPAGIPLCEEDMHQALFSRMGGHIPYSTPRREPDRAEIFSGVFEGQTTGAPISIIIHNQAFDSSKYEPIKDLFRPGHANFTYLKKYGIFDHRGGGRASGRETACRVAAGVVAKKFLAHFDISCVAYISSIGPITIDTIDVKALKKSQLFCPDPVAEKNMMEALECAKKDQDSLGGVIECQAEGLPIGLGDPMYEKLEANLAKAMLSLPATKGFEIGEGFRATTQRGSAHNDPFHRDTCGNISPSSNQAGGTLGGISTGLPLVFRVAFKPTSSIGKLQQTINLAGDTKMFKLPAGSRHDTCVAIRAVPVIEAMTALTLADALLLSRSAKI